MPGAPGPTATSIQTYPRPVTTAHISCAAFFGTSLKLRFVVFNIPPQIDCLLLLGGTELETKFKSRVPVSFSTSGVNIPWSLGNCSDGVGPTRVIIVQCGRAAGSPAPRSPSPAPEARAAASPARRCSPAAESGDPR